MTDASGHATEHLARFVVDLEFEEIPQAALRWARLGIIDTIGVSLAATGLDSLQTALLTYIESNPGATRVTGSCGRSSTTEIAALVAGTLAHGLDFDDVGFAMWAHPSAPLTAVILAMADGRELSGEEALAAYVAGYEVEAAIGYACAADHFTKGWHTTATLGAIGAAATASRLLRLDADTTTHALAIAASMSGGVQANIGSMAKPLHAGLAAHNGLRAAGLAAAGIRGSKSAIDGEKGFLRVLGSGVSPQLDLTGLGTTFDLAEIGLGFKLYPSCAGTHRVLDGVLDIVESEDLRPDDVSQVTLDVSKRSLIPLVHPRPRTGLEAKFSLEYSTAIAITDRRAGLTQYSDAHVEEGPAPSLLDKVEVRIHPEQTEGGTIETEWAEVSVETADGRTIERRIDTPKGFPNMPLTDEEFDAKFIETAGIYLTPASVTELRAYLDDLENLASMDDILDLVT